MERRDYVMNQTDGFREMEIYKMACTRLRPDQHAVNKVMQRKRAARRPARRKAVVLAAACIGMFACSIVGTAAARQFQVEFFADGKVLQIGAGLEKKGDQYVIHMEEGTRTSREMTEAEKLGVSVVRHEDQQTIGLVLGEEERDITEEIRRDGQYETIWEKDGKTYRIQVTDAGPEPNVTITEE